MTQMLSTNFQWIKTKLDEGRRKFGGQRLLYKFDDAVGELAPEFEAQRSRQAAEKAISGTPPFISWLLIEFVVLGGLTVHWAKVLNWAAEIEHASGDVHAASKLHRYATLYETGDSSLPFIVGALPVILTALFGVLWYSYSRYHSNFITYSINVHIADAVVCCARLQEQDESKIASTVRRLDRTCRLIEKKILAAHRHRRTIVRRSPRHASARAHASRVAGALRNQISELDTDLRAASKGLALMLLEIGDQYAKGAIGRLLSEEALSEVQPVSRAREALRESLHISFVATVMVAAILLTNHLVPEALVPKDVRPFLLFGSAVVAGTITGGWNRIVRILEVLPGK